LQLLIYIYTYSIVVLHGLNGHPQRTWTAGKPGKSCNFYWPWELRRYLDNVRVIMYGYNADISLGLEKNLASVKDLGLGFLSDIASLRHLSQVSQILNSCILREHLSSFLLGIHTTPALHCSQFRRSSAQAGTSGEIFPVVDELIGIVGSPIG